jgi:hypothetical protein
MKWRDLIREKEVPKFTCGNSLIPALDAKVSFVVRNAKCKGSTVLHNPPA